MRFLSKVFVLYFIGLIKYFLKIFLNSLWGKFAQRNNLYQMAVLSNYQQYLKLIENGRKTIKNIIDVTEDVFRVVYVDKKEYIKV